MRSSTSWMLSKQELDKASLFSIANASYIENLQDAYQRDPHMVDEDWRSYFRAFEIVAQLEEQAAERISRKEKAWEPVGETPEIPSSTRASEEGFQKFVVGRATVSTPQTSAIQDSMGLLRMINAYRVQGHLQANLDPLKLVPNICHEVLLPVSYGFSDADLEREILVDEAFGLRYASVRKLLGVLRQKYCGTIGYEFMHISDSVQRTWLRERIENNGNDVSVSHEAKRDILDKLIKVKGFEHYLEKKFVGAKRFGLDGAESTILAIEHILQCGSDLGVCEVVIGMAHRGRLNVLSQVIQKSHRAIFSEFMGTPAIPDNVNSSGDVKYHLGHSADRDLGARRIHLSLIANPSHLEICVPVVLGKSRAKQDQRGDTLKRISVLPLIIHGDAAFAGQGVVAECLGLSGLSGYGTGGSVHLIINNQIGFTTDPHDSRSSRYPSDLAKTIDSPVFHVNGDDAEAVVRVAKLAIEFRQKFQKPVVIDLHCFRLHGHNEIDEPSITQPLMYKSIRSHRSIVEIYGEQLIDEGLVTKVEIDRLKENWIAYLDTEFKAGKTYKPLKADWLDGRWSKLKSQTAEDKHSDQTVSGVEISRLRSIGEKISALPDFPIHRSVSRFLETRRKSINEGNEIDWATAESLAFGTLLDDGHPIRLSGQDSERGTFTQRHSVVINQENGERYMPLNNISATQSHCNIFNSMLSEEAVLAFDYGYTLADPNTLVLWEAQFGDFANGAQVVFDQFISASERKWLRMSGLVCLLPHGYDGQGPEHSSARLERYLQSSAENNWQVANCTTPANYFHILRRQLKRDFRKPLILMTPKSLLRHRRCKSNLAEMAVDSHFQPVLPDDAEACVDGLTKISSAEAVRRVLVCSGKIYYELEEERANRDSYDVYLLRLEQLYPCPMQQLTSALSHFKKAEIIWCQEEPKNMGAWTFIEPYLEQAVKDARGYEMKIQYVGRPAAASTATGQMAQHLAEQKAIMKSAFED